MPWAELLLRVFREDLLACDRCGGRRVVLAYLSERSVVRLSAAPTPPQAPSLLCSGSWVSVAPRVEAAARAARSQEHCSQSPHLLRLLLAGVGRCDSNKRTLRAGQAERTRRSFRERGYDWEDRKSFFRAPDRSPWRSQHENAALAQVLSDILIRSHVPMDGLRS